MELDLQSLFGLLCTAALIGWDPARPQLPPPPPRIWAHIRGRYWSAKMQQTTSLCDHLVKTFLTVDWSKPSSEPFLVGSRFCSSLSTFQDVWSGNRKKKYSCKENLFTYTNDNFLGNSLIGLALCTRVEMVRGGGNGRPVHLQRVFFTRD